MPLRQSEDVMPVAMRKVPWSLQHLCWSISPEAQVAKCLHRGVTPQGADRRSNSCTVTCAGKVGVAAAKSKKKLPAFFHCHLVREHFMECLWYIFGMLLSGHVAEVAQHLHAGKVHLDFDMYKCA